MKRNPPIQKLFIRITIVCFLLISAYSGVLFGEDINVLKGSILTDQILHSNGDSPRKPLTKGIFTISFSGNAWKIFYKNTANDWPLRHIETTYDGKDIYEIKRLNLPAPAGNEPLAFNQPNCAVANIYPPHGVTAHKLDRDIVILANTILSHTHAGTSQTEHTGGKTIWLFNKDIETKATSNPSFAYIKSAQSFVPRIKGPPDARVETTNMYIGVDYKVIEWQQGAHPKNSLWQQFDAYELDDGRLTDRYLVAETTITITNATVIPPPQKVNFLPELDCITIVTDHRLSTASKLSLLYTLTNKAWMSTESGHFKSILEVHEKNISKSLATPPKAGSKKQKIYYYMFF